MNGYTQIRAPIEPFREMLRAIAMMEIGGEEEYLCRASADRRLPWGEHCGRIPRQRNCQHI